jgi:hypothetical protein
MQLYETTAELSSSCDQVLSFIRRSKAKESKSSQVKDVIYT